MAVTQKQQGSRSPQDEYAPLIEPYVLDEGPMDFGDQLDINRLFWASRGIDVPEMSDEVLAHHEQIASSVPGSRLLRAPMLEALGRLNIQANVGHRPPSLYTELATNGNKVILDTTHYKDRSTGHVTEFKHKNVLRYLGEKGGLHTPQQYGSWLIQRGVAQRSNDDTVWVSTHIDRAVDLNANNRIFPRNAVDVSSKLDPSITPEVVIMLQRLQVEAGVEQQDLQFDLTREVIQDLRVGEGNRPIRGVVGVSRVVGTSELIVNYWESQTSLPGFAITSAQSSLSS